MKKSSLKSLDQIITEGKKKPAYRGARHTLPKSSSFDLGRVVFTQDSSQAPFLNPNSTHSKKEQFNPKNRLINTVCWFGAPSLARWTLNRRARCRRERWAAGVVGTATDEQICSLMTIVSGITAGERLAITHGCRFHYLFKWNLIEYKEIQRVSTVT